MSHNPEHPTANEDVAVSSDVQTAPPPHGDGVEDSRIADEARLLREVQGKGLLPRMGVYFRLSGPGWLQSALTLGGGSLTSSLYLGVLAGFSMLWLQPLALILGIIMLCAIGSVTIWSGERPFKAINEHINPVLGWGWALASLGASMVWALPQYSLANAVVQQNLFPALFGPGTALGEFNSTLIISLSILVVVTFVTWNYGRGGLGVRIYEMTLKIFVAVIVVCFIGVVIRLGISPQGLDWPAVFRGLIPNPALLVQPAEGFMLLLETVPAASRAYWFDLIVSRQQDVMAAAVATAVGINMTFLFGYSILRRRWGSEYTGLMRFDLGMGMLIPFVLATSCVVIASASQFHTVPQPGFVDTAEIGQPGQPAARQIAEYEDLLAGLVAFQTGEAVSETERAQVIAAVNEEDRTMAATLVTRDAFDLERALQPFTGDLFSRIIFGIGVLAMTLSTITLLMVISGFVFCEMLNLPHSGWPFRIGSLAAAVGVLGPFFWARAYFWLAIPTSVVAFMLIPIAYVAFFLMMNQRSLLGKYMPTGTTRITWNVLMGLSVLIITSASSYMLVTRGGVWGITGLVLFLSAVAIAHVMPSNRARRRRLRMNQPPTPS